MRNQLRIVGLPFIMLSTALTFVLAACGSGSANATPTMSVDAIYTAAYQTLTVQHATELALTPPTATPSPQPSPTIAPPPTLNTTALPSFGTPAFGGTTTSGGTTPGCNNSVFVSDVTIPDGTKLTPGFTFKKTWKLMNNGTCDWQTSYKLAFEEGNDMGGASVPVPSVVPVGQQTDITVVLNAPLDPGDYYGVWMLQDDKGAFFGNKITVVIKVRNPNAPTETPTP